MADASDPRLSKQAEYLTGVTLVRKKWLRPKPDWDHDHCAFCWAAFAEFEGLEFLREGVHRRMTTSGSAQDVPLTFGSSSNGSLLASNPPNHQSHATRVVGFRPFARAAELNH